MKEIKSTENKTPRQVAVDFEAFLKATPPAEVHSVLLEYVAETNHQGWEFSRQDMTGIKKFFEDFMIYFQNRL